METWEEGVAVCQWVNPGHFLMSLSQKDSFRPFGFQGSMELCMPALFLLVSGEAGSRFSISPGNSTFKVLV